MRGKRSVRSLPAMALSMIVSLGASMGVSADEADAKKVDLKNFEGTDELPEHFAIGEAQ